MPVASPSVPFRAFSGSENGGQGHTGPALGMFITNMLQIRFLSGVVAADLPSEELCPLVQSDKPVRALKEHLAALVGASRFRQRLFHEHMELQDHSPLRDMSELQLVILDFQDAEDETTQAFISACGVGPLAKVESFLQLPQNPNVLDPEADQAPIHVAAENGQLEVVRLLLEAGADKDLAAEDGNTALQEASWRGHLAVVRELLAAGADKNVVWQDSLTALHWASASGHSEVVRELVEAGADKNAVAHNGTTSLIAASVEGHLASGARVAGGRS